MFSEKVAWWNTIVRDMNYGILIGATTINILLENYKILSIGIIVFLIFLLAKHRTIYFKDFGLKNP